MLAFYFISLVGKGICKPISELLLSFIRRARTVPSMMVFYRSAPDM